MREADDKAEELNEFKELANQLRDCLMMEKEEKTENLPRF